MRTIIFIIILLSVYFGISIFIGLKFAIGLFAILLATLATVFIIKKTSYYKYMEFVNPRYASIYMTKSDDFKKNLRTTEIAILYGLSSFMIFMSIIMPNITLPVNNNIAYVILSSVILTLLLLYITLSIFKKSKKNSSFWFYVFGSVLSAILVMILFTNFIS